MGRHAAAATAVRSSGAVPGSARPSGAAAGREVGRETNLKMPQGHREGVGGAGGKCQGPGSGARRRERPRESLTAERVGGWDQEGAAG